jgi:hypothetical protein
MSAHKPKPPKPKKRPPPWRKPEGLELSEEIRDLERDIVLHSEAHSGAKDDHDERPGVQERDNAETEKPTTSWTRRRRPSSMRNPVPWRKNTVVDLNQEVCDLERDIARHPHTPANTSTRGVRALNRAARRVARLGTAQAREAQGKPKRATRKQG